FGEVKQFEYDHPNTPVEGVVLLLGDFNTGYYGRAVGRTRANGAYALFEFSVSTANAVPVKGIDVATGRTAIGTAATSGTFIEDFIQGLTGFQTLRADLLLPHRGEGPGGQAPP